MVVAAGFCLATTSTSVLAGEAQWASSCSTSARSSRVFRGGGWRSSAAQRTKGSCRTAAPCKKSQAIQVGVTVANLGRLAPNRSRQWNSAGGLVRRRIGCRSDQRHSCCCRWRHQQAQVGQQPRRTRGGRFSRRSTTSAAAAAFGGERWHIQYYGLWNNLCRGGGACCRRQWRVWAMMADDGDEDLPVDESYWEGDEGRKQLNDIEAMKELVAEAEILRKAESSSTTEGGGVDGELSPEEIQKRRTEKLREELARRAKQQALQRQQAETMFSMGQRAYGRGVYDKSVQLLEAALSNVPSSTQLGGEIQIWLAMAYEANNRHGDCISLYRRIEASHPNKKLRRQAAELRYILEAPKLKISREEMVTIPLIERDYDRAYRKSWRQQIRDRKQKPAPAKPKTKDYMEDWLGWDPPRWERSPYFWVAVTVWLTLAGVALMFQD